MQTIYKYQIHVDDRQTVLMPRGARVLSVDVQRGVPCVWALIDTDSPEENRTFGMCGTGHPCPYDASQFVGTFQMHGGDLIFHLFDLAR